MAHVKLDGIGKVFAEGTRALAALDLEIADGEFLVLVGPSGCGKTTALKIVAGLEEPTEGRILIDGSDVSDVQPGKRDVAMVFQNYALYPHMTVADNIGFGLRMRKTPRDEIKTRVDAVARTLGLSEVTGRRPRQLSGGQRQRVAMGRAIVREPAVFLMDEPLSNLDARLRVEMRAEIARIQRKLKITTMYVTHDQTEAMTMGDRVAVMRKGVLQQIAGPRELYRRPANLFVASFIGSPAMNLIEAEIEEAAGQAICRVGEAEWAVPMALSAKLGLGEIIGRTLCLGVRPEHFRVSEQAVVGSKEEWRIRAEPVLVEELGSELVVHFETAARPAVTGEVVEIAQDVDAAVAAELMADARRERAVLVARLRGEDEFAPNGTVDLCVDPFRVYFFDPATGLPVSGVAGHGDRERAGATDGAR